MRHHRDVFASVRARASMCFGPRLFDGAANFVAGYDQACEGGVLEGFAEWLAQRGACGAGGWREQVLELAFPGVESPRGALAESESEQAHALGVLFDLIATFDEVHLRPNGLKELYTGSPSPSGAEADRRWSARRARARMPPDPDYHLDVCDLTAEHWRKPELAAWLAHGWQLTVNDRLSINFLARVPTAPWPPPQVQHLLDAQDANDAARAVITSGRFLVAPHDGQERIEELVGHPFWERQSIVWVSSERYARLDRELAALHQRPLGLPGPRLHDLADDSALRELLVRDVPRAGALDDGSRALLCLPPQSTNGG